MKILMVKDGKVVDVKGNNKKTPITSERPTELQKKEKSTKDLQKSSSRQQPNPTLYSNKNNSLSAKMLQTKKISDGQLTPSRSKKGEGSQGKLERGKVQGSSNNM